jgi:hypothetical protein
VDAQAVRRAIQGRREKIAVFAAGLKHIGKDRVMGNRRKFSILHRIGGPA